MNTSLQISSRASWVQPEVVGHGARVFNPQPPRTPSCVPFHSKPRVLAKPLRIRNQGSVTERGLEDAPPGAPITSGCTVSGEPKNGSSREAEALRGGANDQDCEN